MKTRIVVDGQPRVELAFNKLEAIGRSAKSVWEVRYDAYYAIYVHENLLVEHQNGQAKFLEQPARQNSQILGDVAAEHAKETGDVGEAVGMAARALLEMSQPLVPVDTGFLKRSGNVQRIS